MSPAFPAAAVSASLVLREDGKPPTELDVSVLRIQEGDRLVVRVHGQLSFDTAQRIQAQLEHAIPGVKVLVFDSDMKIEGVLRGSA
jgi:hypothetical protein